MTEIRLYNTKTRRKEVFSPLNSDDVRMYVCGPTVYDRAHIGNARPVIVFDTLFRLLRHVYGPEHVTYARNFTDVDDKINARAAASGRSIREITDETINWFLQDMGALGALEPSLAPRATEYIDEMVAMIEGLIEAGNAYEAEGHVLFDVTSYAQYGSLSGRSIKDMIAGARVEVAPYKRNPMDFVLWKPSDDTQPGWDSPWGQKPGRGRPGWHIECSAMSRELFGERFDIHGGGLDLAFPHHENEKAQSCCQAGEDSFAQVWMHNEMLQVEGKKMSKSLGNFFSVRDLLDGKISMFENVPTGPEIRAAFMLSPYRKTMDYSVRKRHEAKVIVSEFCQTLGQFGTEVLKNLEATKPLTEVVEALANDLDTYTAMQCLHRKKLKNRFPNIQDRKDNLGRIYASQILLGFDLKESAVTKNYAKNLDDNLKVVLSASVSYDYLLEIKEKLLGLRAEAMTQPKDTRDFSKVDQLKTALLAAGVEVRMGKNQLELVRTDSFDASKLEALI